MKKIIAVLLISTMLFTTGGFCLSAAGIENISSFVSVDTSASTEYYNPGNTIYLNFSFKNVTLGDGDGISALAMVINYDSAMVEPLVSATIDKDGDKVDFSSIITNNEKGAWEVFGKIDTTNSCLDFGASDFMLADVLVADKSLDFKIPFRVKTTAKGSDIVFSFENTEAYNHNLTLSCQLEIDDVHVKYAVQPDKTTTLPTTYVPLNVGGYKHGFNNVIYYAPQAMTISEYVCNFIDPISGQDTLNSFAVIVANGKNVITYINLLEGDKSQVKIPKGGYVIGIHKDDTSSVNYLSSNAEYGDVINLYNLNIEATGGLNVGITLSKAGFTVKKFRLKSDAEAVLDKENLVLSVYKTNITYDTLFNMFESIGYSFFGEDSSVSGNDVVVNGAVLDYLDGLTVIMKGDCHADGTVDVFDYLVLKRHILGKAIMDENGVRAGGFYSEIPDVFDYMAIKQYCLGKSDLSAFMPKNQ